MRRRGRAGRRAVELCKSAAIILLLLSVALLTMTAVRLSGSAGWSQTDWLFGWISGQESVPPKKDQEPTHANAVLPTAVTVRGRTGRISFQGDFAVIDGAFESLGSHLAAALDTAGGAESVSQETVTAAAAGSSLSFFYPCDVPLKILADWLDADAAELGISGRDFVLTVDNGTVLLLVGSSSGCWRLTTDANAAALTEVLDDYPADGTLLAVESEAYARLDGMTLIDPALTALSAAAAVNPLSDAFLTATASTMGFNPYGDTTYQDRMGSVYTETDSVLRIDADCVLHLTSRGRLARFSAASAADSDCIEYARVLLSSLTEGLESDARLYCTGLTADGDTLTVDFDYFLAGRPVQQPDGPAASAVFQDGCMTALTFRIRAYTLRTGETMSLIPADQIAAVAPEGLRLTAGYADTGGDELAAGWFRQELP